MLTDMQREALEVALESIGRDEKCGPVGLGALCVIQDMLAASAAPAEGRQKCPQCGMSEPGEAWLCPRTTNPSAQCARATAPTMSEADAKDAARYRWLKACGICELPYDDHGLGPEFNLDSWDTEIDERIDRAAAKEQS